MQPHLMKSRGRRAPTPMIRLWPWKGTLPAVSTFYFRISLSTTGESASMSGDVAWEIHRLELSALLASPVTKGTRAHTGNKTASRQAGIPPTAYTQKRRTHEQCLLWDPICHLRVPAGEARWRQVEDPSSHARSLICV